MIAIDTNVLVRLLVIDDSAQSDAARALVERERVLILRTVLLETEWVLRSRFGLGRSLIQVFFAGLADTSGIEIEADASTRRAIEAYGSGVDFADALHATATTAPFHTFDEKLLKQRKRASGAEIRAVPKARAR
ncbi:MAG: type II toxin-antitoxin system VapC family toxin [Dokdonella sp.]